MATIIYREATMQDLDSLSTIFPRAFHKVNPYMMKLCPDTPKTREWWRQAFEQDVRHPDYDVLIAVDTSTGQVVGSVQLREMKPGSHFGGFVAHHPPTEDHDMELWNAAVKEFAADEERVVGDRPRCLIEVMAVDDAYQGRGIGGRLMSWACEIADRKGCPIFLETSMAKGFYLKLDRGFYVVDEDEKGAAILLREPVKKKDAGFF